MRKKVLIALAIFITFFITFTSCKWRMDEKGPSTDIVVRFGSPVGLVVGFIFDSDSLALPDNELKRSWFYSYPNTISPTDWTRLDLLGWGHNFRECFSSYHAQSVTVILAPSFYNLQQWFTTNDDDLLLERHVLTLDDLGPDKDSFFITYNFRSLCRLRIGNVNRPLAVGLSFPSSNDSLSIIGQCVIGKRYNFECPMDHESKSFKEYFSRHGIDTLTVLVASSEEDLVNWQSSHDDNLLLKKELYTLQDIKAEKNVMSIIMDE